MIELQAGNALAGGEHRGLSEAAKLNAVHEGLERGAAAEDQVVAVMCPPRICGDRARTPGLTRRRAQ